MSAAVDEYYSGAVGAISELQDRLDDLPTDDPEGPFRLLDQTRFELRQLVALLQDAFRLVDRAVKREEPRCAAVYAKEAQP